MPSRVKDTVHRIPLTPKMVLLTALVGVVLWAILDYSQTKSLRAVFEAELTERLARQAVEDRYHFDKYISSYYQAVHLIASRKDFHDYVMKNGLWQKGVIHNYETPGWLPGPSVMRKLVYVHYAFLLDGRGGMREVFYGRSEEPPPSLLNPSEYVLRLSEEQNFMTTIEGKPYLLTSEVAHDASGWPVARLMLAVEINEDFLVSSGLTVSERLVALISSIEPQRVLATNRPDLIPTGATLESLKDRFFITGKAFFDYGSSDLLVGYASFVPVSEVESLTAKFVSSSRRHHALIAFVFISSFALIMFWITKRISGLTERVSEFTSAVIGGAPLPAELGDQLDILDERFHRLTKEVISSTEKLQKARDELEIKVEERTKDLSESEERFRTLFDQAADCFFMFEPVEDGPPVIADANIAACTMHGYTREELIGKPITLLDDPEGGGLAPERAKKIMAGQQLMFEVNHVRKDGSVFPVEVTARLVHIGGKPYIQAIDRDITERKRAVEELKGLYSTLTTLVDHMPEGVILLNAENRIELANPVGAEHLKVLAKAKKGDTLTEIGEHPVKELLVSPPLIKWHDVSAASRIFEVAGRAVDSRGTVFVIRDVTESRTIKQRIDMHERLAAVGQLASGIAHDFNNILTVITGYAEMMLDLDLPEEAKKQVLTIYQSGQRATELITQILDFSRRTVVELRALDLVSFIKEFTEFIRRAIPENINISFDYAVGKPYTIKADLTKIQQVLANLAVNARDAMPGGGEIKFSLERFELDPDERPPIAGMQTGRWIILTVRDTGTGIPAEVLPHIFEPFYTTKAVGKGAGLGLSQVYGIVRQHGGFIDVKTSVGKGSSFVVYLPEVEEKVEAKQKAAEHAELPKGRGETILVVEDERAVLDFISKVLTDLGYALITAKNGVEALGLFEKRSSEIGLVLTDLVMPEMGGVELNFELKKRKPSVKVIALSGYPMAEDKELIRAGFEDFIKKPFQVKTLADAVKKALA